MYDPELEQLDATMLRFRGGLLVTPDGKPFNTTKRVTHNAGPGACIFLMSVDGNIHVYSHSAGRYHHSALFAERKVAGAGEMRVNNGRITGISNKSGHYQPTHKNLLQVLAVLQATGIDLNFQVRFYTATKSELKSMAAFMAGQQLDSQAINEPFSLFSFIFKQKLWLTK